MKFVCIILLYIFVLISCNTRKQALKKNQFPTYPYPLHTFLLDRNNKVLAIGNPINNESIRNIFDKIIKRE